MIKFPLMDAYILRISDSYFDCQVLIRHNKIRRLKQFRLEMNSVIVNHEGNEELELDSGFLEGTYWEIFEPGCM